MSSITKNFRFEITIFRKYVSVLALLALIIFNCLFTQNFVSWVTFSNLFIQASKVVLLGLGMTLIIATGGIDISVGSAMGLSATISAIFLVNGEPAGILLSLIVVAAFGVLCGTLVSKFSILPLIATLALRYILRGLAQGLSGRGTVTYNSPALTQFFITPIAGHFPIHFFILVIAVIIMYLVVNRMKFGFQVEAYGNNPIAAKIAGINTTKIIILCYAVSAIFAWVSGMLEMIMVSSADPSTVGLDMEIDAIAAAVIGGTPITGGYPNIIGTVCGALLLQLITMMCNMNNVPYSTALMIKAGIIVFALFFHGFRKK
ncbi:MAG TPA: ABC transporter permease [Firmicutes bacterium]|jgi:galactofuranose transport system permease protein|nr:ABC transporter permease [Bacillota bacterium]